MRKTGERSERCLQLILHSEIDAARALCTTVNEGFAHEENAIRIIWSAHHYLTREQSARPFSRKNLIEGRQENDALALNVKEVDRYRQTGNEFRRVNDPGGEIARIFGSPTPDLC